MTPQDPRMYGDQPPYQPGPGSQGGYPPYNSGTGPQQDGYPPYAPGTGPQGGYPPYAPGTGMPGTYPSTQPYYQPGPPPPKKKRTGLIIGLVIVGVVLLLCIGGTAIFAAIGYSVSNSLSKAPVTNPGNTSSNASPAGVTATVSTSSGNTTTGNNNSGGHHKVGETVNLDDKWQVAVQSTSTSNGDNFSQPASGKEYLLVKISAKNISAASQTFSSLLYCTLKDANGTQITESITGFATPPDGTVNAGSFVNGTLVYEVPMSHPGLTLQVQGSLEGTPAVYDL